MFAKPNVERIKLRSATFLHESRNFRQSTVDRFSFLSWKWFACLLIVEASNVCLTQRFWSLLPEPVGAGQNAEQVISISGTAEARTCQMVGWGCTSNRLHFWDRRTRNRCIACFQGVFPNAFEVLVRCWLFQLQNLITFYLIGKKTRPGKAWKDVTILKSISLLWLTTFRWPLDSYGIWSLDMVDQFNFHILLLSSRRWNSKRPIYWKNIWDSRCQSQYPPACPLTAIKPGCSCSDWIPMKIGDFPEALRTILSEVGAFMVGGQKPPVDRESILQFAPFFDIF